MIQKQSTFSQDESCAPTRSRIVLRLALFISLILSALSTAAMAANARFSVPTRMGMTTGDQWEPSIAADASGHVFILYPQYGKVAGCEGCRMPSMLLVSSSDNGKTWSPSRVMLESTSGQFDAQIAVDPADGRTLYAAWLQNGKRAAMLAKSIDSGATWSYTIAVRSEVELDKPALAVRAQNVYVAFNHEEEVWVASSTDGGRSFAPVRVNADSRPGWSLLGSALVDAASNVYLAWSSYSKSAGARGAVQLYVAKSGDEGKSWSTKPLGVSAAAPGCGNEQCGEAYLGPQIALASDSDGTLYALWNAGQKAMGSQRIFFSSSTDGGDNWLPRASVSHAAAGVEHAFPIIVAGSSGDVRVAWMDSRGSTRNSIVWNTYYRSSSNGGATWGEELRLSAYIPGYRYILRDGFRFPFGDYFGLTIDNRGDSQLAWGQGMNYQSPGSIWHVSGH